MKALAILVALATGACVAQPMPQAQISPPCPDGQRGCLRAYDPYELPPAPPPALLTSQPDMIGLRQGMIAVCR